MRGHVSGQGPMFLMIHIEDKVPADHPLRAVKRRCDRILADMRRDFNTAYSRLGRPSIPPEQLLKALLLQALYSIRSEILLMQAIDYNLLYRWFLDLPGDDPVWTPEVFSMNRERFARHNLLQKFFDRIVAEAITEQLASPDHFTVDGTLIRSWASHKSLVPKDGPPPPKDGDPGNPSVNWHGQKRSNATHVSTTDPEARLARKGPGKEAHLCHSGHVLMENRHGLVLAVAVDAADGTAERRSAKVMLKQVRRRHRLRPKTMGMDAGFDDGAFLADMEADQIVPHVPVRVPARRDRLRADDEAGQARRRATRRMKTKAYAISQRLRKRVEEIFGWMKTVGDLARTRFVGRWKIRLEMLVTGAAYNLLRLVRLAPPPRRAGAAQAETARPAG
ncbi:MAG TPA: IS5 family transposase [Phycisphaerae bacterium]|nr:IS5 family transposase [Phycisphaerae bacterium]